MRDHLTGLLEKADLALASVSEVVEDRHVTPLIEVVNDVRTRLAYPEDVLVVALAGGTGSGKSSLLNALCEEDLVDVGGVRPTTSRPAAAIPEAAGSSLDGYLDRLGVEERHWHRYWHQGPRVCLLDLPDTDSVELEHRYRVDAILPLVDVVVWVTDPEKYRDARLHEEYIAPLSAYSAQFVFVVNQADRLSAGEGGSVRDDMRTALEADGVDSANVILMAASPPAGPPIGLGALVEVLESRARGRDALYGKLLTDLAETSRRLESMAGTGLDFDDRARTTLDHAAGAIEAGDAPLATDTLTGFIDSLEGETGGVTADKLAAISASVPDHVRRIVGEVTAETSTGSDVWRWLPWRRRSDSSPDLDIDHIISLLSAAVVRPARTVLARRAVAVASVAELAVEVERLRAER